MELFDSISLFGSMVTVERRDFNGGIRKGDDERYFN